MGMDVVGGGCGGKWAIFDSLVGTAFIHIS